ncbi:MAG: response regulator [Treponema sp.]|nr:response regulator [Treponema sp.]
MDIELKGKKVLLVEDNEMNRKISSEVLSEEGVIVTEAEDGDIAVDILKMSTKDSFDFVLMDIMMPRMDGYSAAAAIRALADKDVAGIPIIAMTAADSEEDKEKSLEVGMNAHLSKPVKIPELLSTIKNFLQSYSDLDSVLSNLE